MTALFNKKIKSIIYYNFITTFVKHKTIKLYGLFRIFRKQKALYR